MPHGGLREATRRQLEHRRDCASQILKAAMAINSNALAEMAVPVSYLDSLPKVHQSLSTGCRTPVPRVPVPVPVRINTLKLTTFGRVCVAERARGAGRRHLPVHHLGPVLPGLPPRLPRPVVGIPGAGDRQPRRGLHLRVAPEGGRRRQIVLGHREGHGHGHGEEGPARRARGGAAHVPQAAVPRAHSDELGHEQDPVQQGSIRDTPRREQLRSSMFRPYV